jgi:large subunit ribosomal protein L30
MSQIKVWQKVSANGQPHPLKRVVWSMGLRKMGQVKLLKDNNCTRGMINKVKHLVAYELVK